MKTIQFMIFLFFCSCLSQGCKKEHEDSVNPDLWGQWKYIGYISNDDSKDIIRPEVYHDCDSCMSVFFGKTSYYGRSDVKKISTKAYTENNRIFLGHWDGELTNGEIGLDEVYWSGLKSPDTWAIIDNELKIGLKDLPQKLLFKKIN